MQEDASPRVERTASVLAVVLPVLVVAGAIILSNIPAAQPPQVAIDGDAEPLPPYFHLLLVPLLIAWIGALALSRRGIARFLSSRALVLGGFISYSLYMTHLVWFGLWRAGMKAVGITGGALYVIAFIGLVVGAVGHRMADVEVHRGAGSARACAGGSVRDASRRRRPGRRSQHPPRTATAPSPSTCRARRRTRSRCPATRGPTGRP